MEKTSSFGMDLEEWEVLSNDGLYILGRESRKPVSPKGVTGFYPKSVVDMNYFDPSRILVESMEDYCGKTTGQALSPAANMADPTREEEPDEKIMREVKVAPPPVIFPEDRFAVSLVFPKKLKEDDEFADMKQQQMAIDHDDCKEEVEKVEEEDECMVKGKGCWEGIGFNIWRWRISGIGALCSIGVAAATICILILGGQNRQKQQSQKIQFQIFADDKNLKQMVQHASRLNQAISATRGVPTTRANISFGGYYDGL